MRTLLFLCVLATTASAEDLLFLDVPQDDWNCSTVDVALTTNASAVQSYMHMLARGWIIQAIQERYVFNGQIETNTSGIDIIGTTGIYRRL